jgi:hypothetical protein
LLLLLKLLLLQLLHLLLRKSSLLNHALYETYPREQERNRE